MKKDKSLVKQRDVVGLTESPLATIYGCCGLFDMCSDADLMSLSFAGKNKFLDWVGWQKTDVCIIRKNFITFVRPEQAAGIDTEGWLENPCDDAHSHEWGTCDFELTDFARLRRVGPTRDITKTHLRLCEAQPRYRIDGSAINDDREYDLRLSTEVQLQDLKKMMITGNKLVGGQFDGLQQLVTTGYTNTDGRLCSSMDSTVINWNGNDMGGGNGITWNGNPVLNTFDFVDVLQAIVRHVKDRLNWAPALGGQEMTVKDMIFLAPSHVIRCLLDAYTCWSVCVNSVTDTYESRDFRKQLGGGAFGDGKIFIDGFEIPMLAYGWNLINSPLLSDAYLLTGAVGTVKLIQGQYNDLSIAAGVRPDRYDYIDGGKLLVWSADDNTCERRNVEMQPRLLSWAPWAQTRIQNIRCVQPGPILSPDPSSSFFIESSMSVVACP